MSWQPDGENYPPNAHAFIEWANDQRFGVAFVDETHRLLNFRMSVCGRVKCCTVLMNGRVYTDDSVSWYSEKWRACKEIKPPEQPKDTDMDYEKLYKRSLDNEKLTIDKANAMKYEHQKRIEQIKRSVIQLVVAIQVIADALDKNRQKTIGSALDCIANRLLEAIK